MAFIWFSAVEIAPYSPVSSQEDTEEKDKLKTYYNALNMWVSANEVIHRSLHEFKWSWSMAQTLISPIHLQLCDTLFYENSNVDIELIDVENEGSCIKFSPLDTAQGIFQILLPK